ncbi:5-oxoprolinase subunit PxpB [Shouchella shacheensis]|uniref:5-oxoprolinase subunit PxpB n=1 Tax=Shouchella shacheensis TaxID=1649580 RepID=UPI0007402609|nr:5-oxoprolinase subunit PxpB [Shouchella shacheensis]
MPSATYTVLSEHAVNLSFGNEIKRSYHQQVKNALIQLTNAPFAGFRECVPSYTGVTVFYDPLEVLPAMNQEEKKEMLVSKKVIQMIEERIQTMEESSEGKESKIVTIPVCYEESLGPDLPHVARVNDLSLEEVIAIHTGGEYLVYMLGFAPGFPFLGGMSPNIAMPRREEPRANIPAGAVGIAGEQTGVYPIETPGGWQLIGQTPLVLFDAKREQPSLLQAGDTVRFASISFEEFHEQKEAGR